MLSEKKAKVAKTFFTIGVGTFLILIYLFLFNQGFEVTDALWGQEGVTVNVQNNSSHLIRDIKLYYEDATGKKKLIKEIDLLAPDEEAQVILQEAYAVNNRIQLIAEAPYHPSVTKEVYLSGAMPAGKEVRLLPSISVPRSVLINTPSLITVKVCNEGSPLQGIKVTAEVDSAFFDIDKTEESFDLAADECIVRDFFITGKQEGSSTILFNILALSLSEEYSATVEIVGE